MPMMLVDKAAELKGFKRFYIIVALSSVSFFVLAFVGLAGKVIGSYDPYNEEDLVRLSYVKTAIACFWSSWFGILILGYYYRLLSKWKIQNTLFIKLASFW